MAQAQLAVVIRETFTPFIEDLGQAHRRLGVTEQELTRERRERLRHDYDVAKQELAGLRLLARSGDRRHEPPARP